MKEKLSVEGTRDRDIRDERENTSRTIGVLHHFLMIRLHFCITIALSA
jgi:hypothetical protein